MSERYQREIEEILNQAGESVPADGSKKGRGIPLIPPFSARVVEQTGASTSVQGALCS